MPLINHFSSLEYFEKTTYSKRLSGMDAWILIINFREHGFFGVHMTNSQILFKTFGTKIDEWTWLFKKAQMEMESKTKFRGHFYSTTSIP